MSEFRYLFSPLKIGSRGGANRVHFADGDDVARAEDPKLGALAVDLRAVGAFQVGQHELVAVLLDLKVEPAYPVVVQLDGIAFLATNGNGRFQPLKHAASIGSIPTDANQEDFVPMGMGAAYKARRILDNAVHVVATELLCAGQGLDLLRPLTPGRGVGLLHDRLRGLRPAVPPLAEDRPPAPDLARLAEAIRAGVFDPASLA